VRGTGLKSGQKLRRGKPIMGSNRELQSPAIRSPWWERKWSPMKVHIIIAFALFWCLPAQASTIKAASCSQSDVQTAINSASTGDIVIVPGPCTAAWSSTVTIPSTKGITVQASGAVTVTQDGFQLNQNASTTSRITGFTFTNNVNCGTGTPIQTSGSPSSATFRIDHNTFTNLANISIMICTSGNGPGLIDHNAFTAGCASEIIHNLGGGDWSDDVVPGSLNMLFIEDNTFTNAGGGCVVQAEEGYTNSRGVFRHNTLFGVANDVHGGTNGGRWWEFYENIYNLGNLGSLPNFIQFRGGSGLYYNNHKVSVSSTTQLGPDCPSSDVCSGSWLVQYQMGAGINGNTRSPAYAWGNDSGMAPSLGPSTVGFVIGGTAPVDATNCSGHPGNVCDYIVASSKPTTLLRCQTAADVAAGCPVSYTYTAATYPHPLQNPSSIAAPTGLALVIN